MSLTKIGTYGSIDWFEKFNFHIELMLVGSALSAKKGKTKSNFSPILVKLAKKSYLMCNFSSVNSYFGSLQFSILTVKKTMSLR